MIAHKLVFSLSQRVRAAMDGWSGRLGRPLRWIGFEHLDMGHPHVHVVVGVYERDLVTLRGAMEREEKRQASLERVIPVRGGEREAGRDLDRIAPELEDLQSRGQSHEVDRSPIRNSRDLGWNRGR